jgi:hypothetical protein
LGTLWMLRGRKESDVAQGRWELVQEEPWTYAPVPAELRGYLGCDLDEVTPQGLPAPTCQEVSNGNVRAFAKCQECPVQDLGEWQKGPWGLANDLCSWAKDLFFVAEDICRLAKDLFFVAEDRCPRASDLFCLAEALFPSAQALFLSAEDL